MHRAAVTALINALVTDELIEVRRSELVSRDLAELVASLGRPPSSRELETWLGEHPQVLELYASEAQLQELIYRHLMPSGARPEQVEAHHPELERQLQRGNASSDLYLIYADWLQQQGDPLGEQIALGVAAERSAVDLSRFEMYLREHLPRLLEGVELQESVAMEWRYGVVDTLTEAYYQRIAVPWASVLRLRVCAFVRSITLMRAIAPESDAAIAEHAPPSLRSLEICVDGNLPVRLMQRDLHRLQITGPLADGDPDFSTTLEILDLRPDEVRFARPLALGVRELRVKPSASMVRYLRDAKLPALERLSIAPDITCAENTIELLERLDLPALRHVTISYRPTRPDAAMLGALRRCPITNQLTSLGLTHLELTDADVDVLLGALGGLELDELDVSGNKLSREGIAALRPLARTVTSTRQLWYGTTADS